jgi:CDP-diacylglycerol--glycerol-3-phosphate 3-phosphatidyltransferase
VSWKKNIPNYLTYFRIAVIPALVLVFPWSYKLPALLFAIASITDWLDGYAARILKAQSNIGRFLDPIADKLLVATALLLLVKADRADLLPAIAIVCREILVSGLREFLAEIRISVPVSKLAKFKTAAQMGAIFFLLLGAGGPAWLHSAFLGSVLLWIAALLTLLTGYAYIKTGLKHMTDDTGNSGGQA